MIPAFPRLNKACQIGMLVLLLLGWHVTASAESFKLVTGEFAPFSGKDLPGEGLTSEIIKHAFESMKHTVMMEFQPWKRGYKNTLTHKYFGTFPYVKTEERSKWFFYSKPIYTAQVRWFVRDDFGIHYEKDEDLQGLRICSPLGYSTNTIQNFIDKKIVKLIVPKGDEECFELLKIGRAQLYAVNLITGWHVIQKKYGTKEGFRTLDKPLPESTYHLMVAKDYPDVTKWLDQFNEGLEQLQKEGEVQSIISRHLSP